MEWLKVGSDIDGQAAGDKFGSSVALNQDGTIMAVGAPTGQGYVSVYQKVSGVWTLMGSDINGEAADDNSGYSVSLSADGYTLAIGAVGNDGNGSSNAGHVRIYGFSNGGWSQLGSDINGEAAGDSSGYSVSLSADGLTVAIGAIYNGSSDAGHVRIYEFSGGAWSQLGSDINGEAAGDQSGFSVSLSADGLTVAIGAPYNSNNAGHVRIYKFSSGTWSQVGQDIDGQVTWTDSGWSVSLSADGSMVAIGEPKAALPEKYSAGTVRVYQFLNNAWSPLGDFIPGTAVWEQSGTSLCLRYDTTMAAPILAIGSIAIGYDTTAGNVRVFKYSSTNGWVKIGETIEGETGKDKFGSALSLSADGLTVAIGAPFNDGTTGTNTDNRGSVRVYEFVNTLPPPTHKTEISLAQLNGVWQLKANTTPI